MRAAYPRSERNNALTPHCFRAQHGIRQSALPQPCPRPSNEHGYRVSRSNKRILLVSWIGAGHLRPLLGLARQLRARGHRIFVRSHQATARLVESCGATLIPQGQAKRFESLPGAKSAAERSEILADIALDTARDIIAAIAERDIDILVFDPFHLGAALAAEKLGLRSACLVPNPEVAWSDFEHSSFGRIPTARVRRALGLPATERSALVQALTADVVLFPWPAEFSIAEPIVAGVHVQPLRLDSDEETAEARADAHELLIVSSTGGVTAEVLQSYQDLIAQALTGMPVSALMTTPRPALFSKPVPENLRVVEFANHRVELARSRALLSSGGWGTVALALSLETPMVLIPLAFDQPVIAAMCAGHGAGVALSLQEASPDELRAAIDAVLCEDNEYARAARRIAAAMAENLSPAQAAELIVGELIVGELIVGELASS